MKKWLFLVLMIILMKYWFFSASPAEYVALNSSTCPLPPQLAGNILDAPKQTDVPSDVKTMRFQKAKANVTPKAGYALSAKVLSTHQYSWGRESDFSPVDWALGWQKMTDKKALQYINISQRGRFYHWRVKAENVPKLPISVQEIIQMSSNTHLIPADKSIWYKMKKIKKGEHVKIAGWLVNVDWDDGSYWHTSLSRNDTGAGACEFVLVCQVEKINP